MAAQIMNERNQLLLVALETNYGTYPVVDGTNLIEFNEVKVEAVHDKETLERIRGALGSQGAITTSKYAKVMTKNYLVGSGAIGTAPAWAPMMLIGGHAEVVEAGVAVEYTPIDSDLDSASAAWRSGSVEHKLLGMRGDLSLNFEIGKAPLLSFDGYALYQAPTADVADPANLTFVNVIPESVQADTVTNFTFYGAPVAMKSLSVKLGNKFSYTELIEHTEVELDDRETTGTIKFRCTEDEYVNFLNKSASNAFGDLDLLHGTIDGKKVGFKADQIQMTSVPKLEWDNGKSYLSVDFGCVPASKNTDYTLYLQ